MKTKFRVFTALLLALMVLVSVLPLQAAAEIGQSGTATRAEAENTAEAALSVKPMLTPSYTPSASYRSGKYYTQLCNVSLTGNQRTDLVNVARSQVGYHEGDNESHLYGGSSGSSNYTEYGYWYGTQVQGSSSGFYASWCAIFISWCARQAGIPTSIISNATYACAGSDYGDFKNLDFYSRGSYTPKVGDLIFFDWLDGDQYVWDHVEIVIGVDSSNVTTLGGNTGTNDVKTRNWNLSHQYIKGYGVPKYTSGSNPTPTPTPTPTPSGSVQDLTNPKNPNKYSTPPSGTYLNVGDSGTYVRWLQACLNQCGYSCDVDGQFGYGTAEALKSFQRKYGLTVDGGFGPECRTKIIAVLTVATPNISVANVENGKKVTITSGNGATIFYTTNGSNPTESSTKYTGAFTLYGSATVKAVAMQNCRFNSGVKSTQVTVTRPGKPTISAVCVAQRVWIGWTPTSNTNHYDVRIYRKGSQTEMICDRGVMNTYAAYDLPAGEYYANVAACTPGGVLYTFSDETDCFTVTDISDNDYQPIATVTSGNHRYTLYEGRMGSWQEAKEFCERQGGHLVTITSSEEQQTVKSLLLQYSSDASCWLGCNRLSNGSWAWITDEFFNYTNWRSGEPNNSSNNENYGMAVGDSNAQWNDVPMVTNSYNMCVVLEEEIVYHTVTFKDWNGTVLKTEQVQYGGAATAPANPTRTGYTFTGWDKAFNNVTADLVVTAQYSINTYTVTFKDWNGTVLKTQQVQYGGAATAPANPTRAGYTFTGWDKAFTNVTANLVVTAQYVQNEPVSTPVPSDAPQIVVGSKTTMAGNTVTVDVSLKNNPGIISMMLHLSYDDALTLVSIGDTGLMPGRVHGDVTDTLFWDSGTSTENLTVNGVIATLTFKVDENAEPGEYGIRFTYNNDESDIINADFEPVDFAVVNGKIKVSNVIIGDVDMSGSVNAKDRVVLGRYLTHWPGFDDTTCSVLAADVNGDGKVNALDRVILGRYLTHWPGYEELPYTTKGDSQFAISGVQRTGEAPQIIVDSASAEPGETFTVNVSLANNPGVISMMLHLSYDDALTLINIGDTGLFPGRVHGDVTDVLFWDYGTSSQNFTGNGVIATLTFTLSEEAEPGEYHICLSYDNAEGDIINIDFEPVEFAVQNGAVTVAAAQPEMHTVTFKDWDGTVLKTQEVQHGGDAEAPADPTRVGYTFTGWDKEFTNITADLVVTAQYEINTYTVTFKDWDGTVLKTQEVQHGGDAEAPADPTRTGYTFTGWDKAFTNITADLVVTAQYSINTYTVTFKDWNGTVLKTQEVQFGGDAEAPADPTRTGYTFTGWDKAFTNITTDLVVTAQYSINTYTVTFKDWDGTVLKTQEVQYGGDAEAPADPTRTGYTFTGWDKAFTNVTADLVVTAQYEINTYTVTFKDWDGTVLKTQEVQYGGDAEAPADPTRTGYTFTGWDKAFTNVTADLVVTAQYEMLGDVDDDGNVSMADALTILRMAMDILPVENQQIADVDGDGFITSMDALLALRFAMHIEQ